MIQILRKIFGREKLEDNVSLANKETKPVKEILKKLSLDEVREKARAIPKSSCGCYRHGARQLFYQEKNDNPNRTLALYEILSSNLHSYCNSTKSPYSGNNKDVIKDAFYASIEIISDEGKDNLEEVIGTQYRVIWDLKRNSGNFYRDIKSDDINRLIRESINLADIGRYFEAILLLRNAETLANERDEESISEVIKDLKRSYLQPSVKEIDNLRDKKDKTNKLSKLGYDAFSNEEIGKKLINKSHRLNDLVDKPIKSDERLISHVRYYFDDNKISPLEKDYREIKYNLEKNAKKLCEETSKQKKLISDKINYLRRFEIKDDIVEQMISYENKLGSLEKEASENLDKIKNEEIIKLNQVENEIDLARKERDQYINKIKSRMLTNPEYKSLLIKMRFKERKNDK